MKLSNLFIVLLSVLLFACGHGENSGIPTQGTETDSGAGTSALPKIVKLSISTESDNKMAIGDTMTGVSNCNNCNSALTKYTWTVDTNDDGKFSGADAVVKSNNLTINRSYFGHQIKLSATAYNDHGLSSEAAYNVYQKVVAREILNQNPKQKSFINFVRFSNNDTYVFDASQSQDISKILTYVGTWSKDKVKTAYSSNSALLATPDGIFAYGIDKTDKTTGISTHSLTGNIDSTITTNDIATIGPCGSGKSDGFAILKKDNTLSFIGDVKQYSLDSPDGSSTPPTAKQTKLFTSIRFCASIDTDGKMSVFTPNALKEVSKAADHANTDLGHPSVTNITIGNSTAIAELSGSGTGILAFGKKNSGGCDSSGSNPCIPNSTASGDPGNKYSYQTAHFTSPIKTIVNGFIGFSILLNNHTIKLRGKIDKASYGTAQLDSHNFTTLYSPIYGNSYIASTDGNKIIGWGSDIYTTDDDFDSLDKDDLHEVIDNFESSLFVKKSGTICVKKLSYSPKRSFSGSNAKTAMTCNSEYTSLYNKYVSANRAVGFLYQGKGILRLFGRTDETGITPADNAFGVKELTDIYDVGSVWPGFLYIDNKGSVYSYIPPAAYSSSDPIAPEKIKLHRDGSDDYRYDDGKVILSNL